MKLIDAEQVREWENWVRALAATGKPPIPLGRFDRRIQLLCKKPNPFAPIPPAPETPHD